MAPKPTATKKTLRDLANDMAEKLGISKNSAYEALTATFTDIAKIVDKDGKVTIFGFGSFYQKARKARTGVNPQNPTEKLKYPASKTLAFKCVPSQKKKATKK